MPVVRLLRLYNIASSVALEEVEETGGSTEQWQLNGVVYKYNSN